MAYSRSIDAVVNLWTDEVQSYRPAWRDTFFVEKMRVDAETSKGISIDEMLRRMDRAGIERSFLIAPKVGREGHRSTWRLPYEVVLRAVKAHPNRFFGIAGVDPTEGMKGVWEFQRAVEEYGFIGAHGYPHWFEIAPDQARWYPIYAKCIELDVPIQLQVGQSMVYAADYPCRSVGRPITFDSIACDLPELKLVGIHVGIPWTEEMIAMAWKHKNVYIGSDAHGPKYWPQSFVNYINTYGQDKVIFGTDFPVLDFERTVNDIKSLGLREGSARKFMRDNVIKLYKLDQHGVALG